MTAFADRIQAWETEFLSGSATPSYPARRRVEEPDSPLRTPFQRDRDRIVHSKAFRRLKHKTQVFVNHEGDYYRTRLTHTLEATQITRSLARFLNLNEDLAEAIALVHYVGHPPFGHAGEKTLDAAMRAHGDSFDHNLHALRIVEGFEQKNVDFPGLNLTFEVRNGIVRHSKGRNDILPRDSSELAVTLEGQIVRIADIIAYVNHDIDDALRAGILRSEELPAAEIELLGPSGSARIDTLVRDIVARSAEAGDIVQSEEVGGAMLRLRKFMFDRVYLGEAARRESERVHRARGHAERPLGEAELFDKCRICLDAGHGRIAPERLFDRLKKLETLSAKDLTAVG